MLQTACTFLQGAAHGGHASHTLTCFLAPVQHPLTCDTGHQAHGPFGR